MTLLARFFAARRPPRHFALLDNQGLCRALRQCRECPTDGNWIEVNESCPAWLGRPLAPSARLAPEPAQAGQAQPLAA